MEYLRGWRALVADPEWKSKVGVATVLVLSTLVIPILGQLALAGWLALSLRRAVLGQDSPLPPLRFDIDYLKELLTVGFKPMVAQLLYTLPMVFIGVLTGCFSGFIQVAARNGAGAGWILAAAGVLLLAYFVAMIVVIPLASVAALRASLMDDLKAAIGFKAVRAMTRILLKDILVGSFVMMLVTMPVAMLGLALCYFGVFPAAVIISVMHTYFHAELYKVYLRKGGAPLTIGAIDVGPKALVG